MDTIAPKTIEENFTDWEATVFGFGYGSGERHTLGALKEFMGAIDRSDLSTAYDYEVLELAVTPTVAWLLISALCRHSVDIIEYGTSPRYGWLTKRGIALKTFVDASSLDDLVKLCTERGENYTVCSPDVCNCGPQGYVVGRKCPNPFWD